MLQTAWLAALLQTPSRLLLQDSFSTRPLRPTCLAEEVLCEGFNVPACSCQQAMEGT